MNSERYPFLEGGVISMYRYFCHHWVHKRCKKLDGTLTELTCFKIHSCFNQLFKIVFLLLLLPE